jgi:hypothetical protein
MLTPLTLYVGSLLCLAIREDGQRGETVLIDLVFGFEQGLTSPLTIVIPDCLGLVVVKHDLQSGSRDPGETQTDVVMVLMRRNRWLQKLLKEHFYV